MEGRPNPLARGPAPATQAAAVEMRFMNTHSGQPIFGMDDGDD